MTKKELVEFIVADLTASGKLDIDIDKEEVERIIDAEERYAYMMWQDCVEIQYAVMNPDCFMRQEFRKTRTIQLPDCVWGVSELREIKDGGRLFGINDPNLNMEQIMGSDLWLSPFSSDVIASRTISYSWFDLARSFTLRDIRHKFNPATHRLQILGRDPQSPVLIEAYCAIPREDLYEYYYYRRWCIAHCKISMHKVLKKFTYNVIGGVQITDLYKEEGEKEIEEIKRTFKEDIQPTDWLIMTV